MGSAAGRAPDDVLIRRSRRGDADSFAELVRRHQADVFATALRVVGDRDDALAIANTTFYRAYEHLAEFDESRSLRPWLARIASRMALDHVRDRTRRERFREPPRRDDEEESPAERVPGGELPEDVVVRREISGALARAIRSLPERQQEVTVLRFVNDLSYEEIARVTGLTVSNIGVILLRARAALRKTLDREGISTDDLS
jgi:RNA polymerase sigma-70 factor, ECF subfamily